MADQSGFTQPNGIPPSGPFLIQNIGCCCFCNNREEKRGYEIVINGPAQPGNEFAKRVAKVVSDHLGGRE